MRSTILETAINYLLPLMLLFALAVEVRGHNEPGGGFVGGLVAAAAFAVYSLAYGPQRTREAILVPPTVFIGVGLALTLVSALVAPIVAQLPFLTGVWVEDVKIGVISIGTPTLFDLGVSSVVLGVTLMIVLTLAEETAPRAQRENHAAPAETQGEEEYDA